MTLIARSKKFWSVLGSLWKQNPELSEFDRAAARALIGMLVVVIMLYAIAGYVRIYL
jgi:hypothetical protein